MASLPQAGLRYASVDETVEPLGSNSSVHWFTLCHNTMLIRHVASIVECKSHRGALSTLTLSKRIMSDLAAWLNLVPGYPGSKLQSWMFFQAVTDGQCVLVCTPLTGLHLVRAWPTSGYPFYGMLHGTLARTCCQHKCVIVCVCVNVCSIMLHRAKSSPSNVDFAGGTDTQMLAQPTHSEATL